MYPHPNLTWSQREAIDRLGAATVRFARTWHHVWLTDPLPHGAAGLTFYPKKRRTWTVYVKGYPVVRVYGRCREE